MAGEGNMGVRAAAKNNTGVNNTAKTNDANIKESVANAVAKDAANNKTAFKLEQLDQKFIQQTIINNLVDFEKMPSKYPNNM